METIHTIWIEERKVQQVEWGPYTQRGRKRERYGWFKGPHTLHRGKRGRYGWLNGALHKNWMEERKEQLVE